MSTSTAESYYAFLISQGFSEERAAELVARSEAKRNPSV